MKVLIIGASGQIGGALVNEFSKKHDVLGADIEPLDSKTIRLDMTDAAAVNGTVSEFRPHVLLLPAANPHVDGCEEDPQACSRINVEGTKNAALAAENAGAKFVFFSSDYVFDGINGPYDEAAGPNPVSEYGRQKLAGERITITANAAKNLIIRTTVVYGPERRGKNFVLNLIKKLRNGEKVRVPADQTGTPTYSPNLAEAVRMLIESGAGGVFNVAGPTLVNRLEFAESACGIFGLDKGLLLPVRTEELNQKAKRPLKAGLKIDKLLSTVPVRMLGPVEGLSELRSALNC